MSAYVSRYCKTHGEWDTDVDNPGDCPECPDERDALRARVAQLEAALRDVLSAPRDAQYALVLRNADAALAASPDDAGRRWEAMREVCEAAVERRRLTELLAMSPPQCSPWQFDENTDRMCDALARLDAEGK